MARLRNTGTGVVVDVSDDTAALLDARTWVKVDAPVPAKKAAAKKTAASSPAKR